jgi:hypothetical protein
MGNLKASARETQYEYDCAGRWYSATIWATSAIGARRMGEFPIEGGAYPRRAVLMLGRARRQNSDPIEPVGAVDALEA